MKRTLVTMCAVILIMFTAERALGQGGSDYKSRIESINKDMVKYMLEGNSEKLLSLYTSDAISLPSYHPMLEGIDAIKTSSDEMAKTGVKYTSFEPVTVKVLVSGNLITEIGTYKISMTMKNSDKPMNDEGKYLTIWEKQKDGSLKIKVETWNSDVDPMKTMSTMSQKAPDNK